MKTYWNYSIVLLALGIVSAITGGSFWILPESWTSTTIILGKFALFGGIAVAGYNVLALAIRELREILRSHREGIGKALDSHGNLLKKANGELLTFGEDVLSVQREQARSAQCQAHFAAGTALTLGDVEKMETLLKRLATIRTQDGKYARAAENLYARLDELQYTRDGLNGPQMIAQAEQFVELFDRTVTAYSAVEAADKALKAAQSAHEPLIAELNAFAA